MEKIVITSARQALRESKALKSYWSAESRLSQRILIYCAELLEKIEAKGKRPKRPATAWQKFMSKRMKAGASVQEAARLWKERK